MVIWLYSSHKLENGFFENDLYYFSPVKQRPYERFYMLDTPDRMLFKHDMLLAVSKDRKLKLYKDGMLYSATAGKDFELSSGVSGLRKSSLKESLEEIAGGEPLEIVAPVALAVSTFSLYNDEGTVQVTGYRSANTKSGYLYRFNPSNEHIWGMLLPIFEKSGFKDSSYVDYCFSLTNKQQIKAVSDVTPYENALNTGFFESAHLIISSEMRVLADILDPGPLLRELYRCEDMLSGKPAVYPKSNAKSKYKKALKKLIKAAEKLQSHVVPVFYAESCDVADSFILKSLRKLQRLYNSENMQAVFNEWLKEAKKPDKRDHAKLMTERNERFRKKAAAAVEDFRVKPGLDTAYRVYRALLRIDGCPEELLEEAEICMLLFDCRRVFQKLGLGKKDINELISAKMLSSSVKKLRRKAEKFLL